MIKKILLITILFCTQSFASESIHKLRCQATLETLDPMPEFLGDETLGLDAFNEALIGFVSKNSSRFSVKGINNILNLVKAGLTEATASAKILEIFLTNSENTRKLSRSELESVVSEYNQYLKWIKPEQAAVQITYVINPFENLKYSKFQEKVREEVSKKFSGKYLLSQNAFALLSKYLEISVKNDQVTSVMVRMTRKPSYKKQMVRLLTFRRLLEKFLIKSKTTNVESGIKSLLEGADNSGFQMSETHARKLNGNYQMPKTPTLEDYDKEILD